MNTIRALVQMSPTAPTAPPMIALWAIAVTVSGCDLTETPRPKPTPEPESILVFKSEADRLAIQHRNKEYIEFEWAGESWRIPMGNFGGVSVHPSNEGRAISVFAALQSSTDATDKEIRFSPLGVLPEDRKLIALIMRDTQSGKPPRVSIADRVRGRGPVSGQRLDWQSFPASSAQLGWRRDHRRLMFPVIWVPAVTDALGEEVVWKCTNLNGRSVREYLDGFDASFINRRILEHIFLMRIVYPCSHEDRRPRTRPRHAYRASQARGCQRAVRPAPM